MTLLVLKEAYTRDKKIRLSPDSYSRSHPPPYLLPLSSPRLLFHSLTTQSSSPNTYPLLPPSSPIAAQRNSGGKRGQAPARGARLGLLGRLAPAGNMARPVQPGPAGAARPDPSGKARWGQLGWVRWAAWPGPRRWRLPCSWWHGGH